MVTAGDEWVAEAYLETDYSKITQADFESEVRKYAIYKLLGGSIPEDQENDNADGE